MVKRSKTKRFCPIEESWLDLKILPTNVMRTIIEKMSVEDHMTFRGVCNYAHDEVESYWRSQTSISISQLKIWFPSIANFEWKLNSLSGILNELLAAFNLFKSGNLRKLSLQRVISVNIESLVNCIEMATGKAATSFLENVVELDLRGCFVPPKQIIMIDELFPNLKTILLSSNAIMPQGNEKLITETKIEITHHSSISSSPKEITIDYVPAADMHLVAFIRKHLPDVSHIFIDRNY